MASEVDISNLGLSNLGDRATVSSLDPPEGSAQAEHCARFYPIARNGLLEMHDWGFATRRANLAPLGHTLPQWTYSYAVPSDLVRVVSVLPTGAREDADTQPYVRELSPDGTAQVIYTNQENAVLRYTALVTDTTRFSPLFVVTLGWYLASMLAGPIIKGDAGKAEAKRCLEMAMIFLSRAAQSDARQQQNRAEHTPGWIDGR